MISLAFKESQRSVCRTRHGCVIAKNGRVFGKGHNTYKTHPTWGGGPLMTLHAEAAAIRDAVRRGINVCGSTLFVTRGDANRLSKPCVSCQALLEKFGITKICYTDENGNMITEWPL